MNDLITKISSYNLFNYLFPWVIFIALLESFTNYSINQDNILIFAFVAYFIGLVASRIWSVIIEPLLKKFKVLKFADYWDFIQASKEDTKIEILSEQNNMYRTIISVFVLFVVIKLYENISIYLPWIENRNPYILSVLIIMVFICAYSKQTEYITNRIKKALSK